MDEAAHGLSLPANKTPDTYNYSYSVPEQHKTLSVADTVKRLRSKVAPFRFQLAARNISRELHLEGGEKVLELGSGLGLLGEAIKKEVDGKVDYFGIELFYRSAQEGKKRGLETSQADTVNLPFVDASFDAIVSTDVLEHVPDAHMAVEEMHRILKDGGKAFIVIADPSEGRFTKASDHIDRSISGSDVFYWEKLFEESGFKVLSKESQEYRDSDWRKIFNLPFLVKFKEEPGFACAFNPVNRPGTYILQKQ